MHFRKLLNKFSEFHRGKPDGVHSDSSANKYFRSFIVKDGIGMGCDGYVQLYSFPPPVLKLVTLFSEGPQSQAKKLPERGAEERCPDCSVPQKVLQYGKSVINKRTSDSTDMSSQSAACSRNANEMNGNPSEKIVYSVSGTVFYDVCKRITHGIIFLLSYFDNLPKFDSVSIVVYVLRDVNDYFLSASSTRRKEITNISLFCFDCNKENLITKLKKSPPPSLLNDEEKDVLFIVYLLYKKSLSYRELFVKFNEYGRVVPDSAISWGDQYKYICERKRFFILEKGGLVKLHPLPVIEQSDSGAASTVNYRAPKDEKWEIQHSTSNVVTGTLPDTNRRSRSRKRSRSSKRITTLADFFDPGLASSSNKPRGRSKKPEVSQGKSSIPPGFRKCESPVPPNSELDSYKLYCDNMIDSCLAALDTNGGASSEETLNSPSVKRRNSHLDKVNNSRQEVRLNVDRFYDYSSHKDPAKEIETVNFFTFFISMYKAGVSPDMLLTHLQSASVDIQTYIKDCYHGDVLSFFLGHPALFYISPSSNVYLKW